MVSVDAFSSSMTSGLSARWAALRPLSTGVYPKPFQAPAKPAPGKPGPTLLGEKTPRKRFPSWDTNVGFSLWNRCNSVTNAITDRSSSAASDSMRFGLSLADRVGSYCIASADKTSLERVPATFRCAAFRWV